MTLDFEKMDDDALRELVRGAIRYRSGPDSINTVYLGSMAQMRLFTILRLSYSRDTWESFNAALKVATRDRLLKMVDVCKWVIEFMQKNPMRTCPCCGQIIPATRP